MKIQYKKKRLKYNLIFGLLWLVISLLGIFTKENTYWTDYGFLIISLLYIVTYFYEKKKQYLTIENGILSVNHPFGKKINLSEIKQFRKFAGDYILKSDKTELTINTQIIDEKSLTELNNELGKLNI
ncbi:MAG: hypothetical protein L3J08_09710 [Flavobacteriaceae bacterium]|nr:hypothetical protein [Flavobacteriaceae bacterium]